jgi:hypothetical protein
LSPHLTSTAAVDDDSSSATASTITNYPAFASSNASLSNVLTWHESFVTPDNSMTSAYGMRGGPIVLYGSDITGTVALLSPFDNFLEAAFGDALHNATCTAAGCLTAGVSSTFSSLPPGFTQSYVLVVGEGITATIAAFGSALKVGTSCAPPASVVASTVVVLRTYLTNPTHFHFTRPPPCCAQAWYAATASKVSDLSLTTLGYQTDNGAQLCFGCQGVLDACLLGEKAYLDSINVPIQYLSFQVTRHRLPRYLPKVLMLLLTHIT